MHGEVGSELSRGSEAEGEGQGRVRTAHTARVHAGERFRLILSIKEDLAASRFMIGQSGANICTLNGLDAGVVYTKKLGWDVLFTRELLQDFWNLSCVSRLECSQHSGAGERGRTRTERGREQELDGAFGGGELQG